MAARGGGSIINTASVAGIVGLAGLSAYVASKHAVVGLTRATALEYAQAGIRCNAICPAVVRTAMLDALAASDPARYEQIIGPATASTAMSRIGESAETATAAVFLASDESSFLTGAAIPVDGGYVAA
jgi:NAD(P)-dependent dehydrogenase (short-subunit alcohol dehydrogenase family)